MKNVERIQLNLSNYKNFLPIEIIAFSIAEAGAQGDPGALEIISKDKQLFYLNLRWTDLNKEIVDFICPALEECCFNPLLENQTTPKDWYYVYMGAGNHLYVASQIQSQFKVKTHDLKSPVEFYKKWKRIIIDL